MRMTLRSKLIVTICLPLLVVYLTVLGWNYFRSRQQAVQRTRTLMVQIAESQAAELGMEFSTVAEVARSSASVLSIAPMVDRLTIDELLRGMVGNNPEVFGSCLAVVPDGPLGTGESSAPYISRGLDGELVGIDIAQRYDYLESEWYVQPKMQGTGCWTEPYFDEGAGNILMCTYAVPVWRNGVVAAILTVDISLDDLREQLAESVVDDGRAFLLSAEGTFISHPEVHNIMNESLHSFAAKYESPALLTLAERLNDRETGVIRLERMERDEWTWCVYTPVPSTSWSFVTIVGEGTVLAPVNAELNQQIMVMLAVLGLTVTIIMIVASLVAAPVHKISEAAERIAGGDLQAQVKGVRSRDEVGRLAETFNQMVVDLKANVEARIEETAAREAVERELQIARKIQESLLPMLRPPFPDRPEFTLEADNQPAKFMAGDFFDFWLVDDEHLALVMADVSGKGVPAAMFMAVTRTLIRTFTVSGSTPDGVLSQANDVLVSDNKEGLFVTLFLGYYHIDSGELVYANAGHNPPMVMRNDGTVEHVGDATGLILGVLEDADYTDGQIQLALGDTLLLYTDGVTEAEGPDGEMLEEEGLRDWLAGMAGRSVHDICKELMVYTDQFRNHEAQDDVTVLALCRKA